jgi:plastocyanin
MKSFIPAALAAAVLLGVSPPPKTTHTITIAGFAFAPKSVTVAAGDAITFVNRDQEAHTVVAAGGAFASNGLDTNDSWTVRLQKPGTYAYFCSLHPYMKGTIVVVPAKAGT